MITVLLLSLLGAVIAAVVGTFWFSNATPMGKIHMKYLGFDKLSPEEMEAKPKMPKMYAAQFALSFLTSFSVVFVVTLSIHNGVPPLMAIAFPIISWLCFMVPIIGSALLWSNVDPSIAWKKFFSDISANLVIVVLIALMAVMFA
jgi:uncharacterized membrane protein YhaH (DUF805 family)